MTTFCVADGICVPYLVNEILRKAEQPLYEQNFGLGLMPNDLVLPTAELLSVPLRYLWPCRLLESVDSSFKHHSQQGGSQDQPGRHGQLCGHPGQNRGEKR